MRESLGISAGNATKKRRPAGKCEPAHRKLRDPAGFVEKWLEPHLLGFLEHQEFLHNQNHPGECCGSGDLAALADRKEPIKPMFHKNRK
jgi:hypothetical protein